jgi:hypothetical protein
MAGVAFGIPQGIAVAAVVAVLAAHDTRILREGIFLANLGFSSLAPAAAAGAAALLVEMIAAFTL